MKRGKKYVDAAKLVDRATLYDAADAIALVKKDAAEKMKKLKMELFLNAQDGGDGVNIYAGRILDGDVIHDILIEADEPEEYTIVYIRGEIDVQALTNQYKK